MEKTFSKIKNDYIKLTREYGFPYDMTGGFVDAEKMERVIINPTKDNAANYMKDVIRYGFQFGECWKTEDKEFLISKDAFLMEKYEEYTFKNP